MTKIKSDKFLENSPKEDSQSNGAPTNTCVFTTKYKTNHDGNKMLPLGGKIVWMRKDNYRPNKLDPTHQIDVFASTVPQKGELVVLTPEAQRLRGESTGFLRT